MIHLLALAAFGSAVALPPQTADRSSDNRTEAATSSDADKKVCRREVATGSIMPKLTCHTKGEWAAMREQGEAAAEKMHGNPRTLQPGEM